MSICSKEYNFETCYFNVINNIAIRMGILLRKIKYWDTLEDLEKDNYKSILF